MSAGSPRRNLRAMSQVPPTKRVEVGFVGLPPVGRIERAQGVSEVEADGSVLRCLVCGSFQPFLEALRGHEVIGFDSAPPSAGTTPGAGSATRGDSHA